jgi:isoleucyl-tRNA synthetase
MSKSLGNVTAPQEVIKQYGADILRLWVMNSDTTEDLRIGPEILKQQAELYRRLRNTLRWLLGNLAGFEDSETVPYAELPELERWVLHRLTELDARVRKAIEDYDWTGVYPEIHNFCATDLSAFYFDIRKDALYCDAQDSPRRRATRTVLDALHRCLTAWLAPVLVFTAEEAWLARFPDEQGSIHLNELPFVPEGWRDAALAEKWARVRAVRAVATQQLELARRAGEIRSSLEADVRLRLADENADLLDLDWAETLIVSHASTRYVDNAERQQAVEANLPEGAGTMVGVLPAKADVTPAPGQKCDRCWRVLPEVGASEKHPTLCRRCEAVVEGLA